MNIYSFLQLFIFGNIPILNTYNALAFYRLLSSMILKKKSFSVKNERKRTAFVFSSVGGRG